MGKYKYLYFGVGLFVGSIFLGLVYYFIPVKDVSSVLAKTVHAQDIYKEFVCPCCGAVLDPDNICCGSMKQRIDYIDSLVKAGLSKEAVMMKAVKEFGINALAHKETQEEMRRVLSEAAPDSAPHIAFEKTSYDLGTVKQSDGVVTDSVSFRNTGQTNLVIDKMGTSCGCTSVSIVYKGVEGPVFTMPGHGKENPRGWNVSIAQGDTAQLRVYYDPNAHGKQNKPSEFITRTISVYSNDPIEFEKQILIELEQRP